VLWQHVVCVLGAVQHKVHAPQPETHAATTPRYL